MRSDSTAGKVTKPALSQAELLFEAQQRHSRSFRRNVGLSWGILLLILLYLFSGQDFLGIKTIDLDFEFIRDNIGFIAGGIPQTLWVSFLSIVLATVLALLAAL